MTGQRYQRQTEELEKTRNELLSTGLFKEISVTCIFNPVQVEGYLHNGNYFYFRARGDTATLEINELKNGLQLARFEEVVTPGERFAAGYLDAEKLKGLILRWIQQLKPGHP